MRSHMLVVAVSAACLAISPQGTTPEKKATSLLDLGMSTLQAGQKEGASILFDKARNAATFIQDAASRTELVAKIEFQVTLADPLIQARRKAEANAARALLRAGKVYFKKGWVSTASPFIIEAALLSPSLAAADLKRLATAIPTERVGSGDQIFMVFGHMANAYGQDDWVKTKEGLKAPVDDIDGPSMLLSKSVILVGTKVHFEVLARESECRVGLAIGFNENRSFHLVELFRQDGKSEVRCHTYGNGFKTLVKSQYADKKKDWAKWISFDVEIREKELTWKIGKSKTYITRCKKPELSGRLGFYIVYGDDNGKDFIFRNFRMEEI